MSHPIPGHEYGENEHHESKKVNRKTEILHKLKGKMVGAGIKINNQEYGHKKAKQLALNKKKTWPKF